MQNIYQKYQSFDSFITDMDARQNESRWDNASHFEGREGGFYGAPSFDDAMRLARFGWAEGREKLLTALDAANASLDNRPAPAMTYDVAGMIPNPFLAAAGDPFNMATPAYSDAMSRPVIRLAVRTNVRAGVSGQAVMNFGGALLSLIDALERGGQSVELTATMAASGGSKKQFRVDVVLKQAGENLDLDRLAFAIAHPDMQRRFVFQWRELNPAIGVYGSSQDIKDSDKESGVVYIAGLNDGSEDDCKNQVGALGVVAAKCAIAFKKAGVPFDPNILIPQKRAA
jgi:hypothetical protein